MERATALLLRLQSPPGAEAKSSEARGAKYSGKMVNGSALVESRRSDLLEHEKGTGQGRSFGSTTRVEVVITIIHIFFI